MSPVDKQSPNIKRGGKRAGAGRPPGSLNKLTRTLRESIHKAFRELGGTDWLVGVAKDDPRAFIALLGRTMPPATKDPEEEEGLAMALARARQRVATQQDMERQRLRGMSDEELVQMMEESVRKYRQSGRMDGLVPDAIRKETAREKTLEELVAESWNMQKSHPAATAEPQPCPVAENAPPEQTRPEPPVPSPTHQHEKKVQELGVQRHGMVQTIGYSPKPQTIPGQPPGRRAVPREEILASDAGCQALTNYDPFEELN